MTSGDLRQPGGVAARGLVRITRARTEWRWHFFILDMTSPRRQAPFG